MHFSGADDTIRDSLIDFAMAISNSLVKSVLKANKSNLGGSTAKLGRIPKSVFQRRFSICTGSSPVSFEYLPEAIVPVSTFVADQNFVDSQFQCSDFPFYFCNSFSIAS